MTTKHTAAALFFGILIGCATSQVTQMATVDAQPSRSGFTECVVYTLDYDGDLEDLAANAKPIGDWTPVGGAQVDPSGSVVLCR